MIGELSEAEIENLLHNEVIARVGCHSNGYTYVVPITYAYDGDAVIGYSPDGLKLWMMRENPKVCVEVDHIDDLANWRSVVASGTFQELSGAEAEDALARLRARLASGKISATALPSHGLDSHARALNLKRFSVYRIRLGQKSGRFERDS